MLDDPASSASPGADCCQDNRGDRTLQSQSIKIRVFKKFWRYVEKDPGL